MISAFDLGIGNPSIFDGTGAPPPAADVGVEAASKAAKLALAETQKVALFVDFRRVRSRAAKHLRLFLQSICGRSRSGEVADARRSIKRARGHGKAGFALRNRAKPLRNRSKPR